MAEHTELNPSDDAELRAVVAKHLRAVAAHCEDPTLRIDDVELNWTQGSQTDGETDDGSPIRSLDGRLRFTMRLDLRRPIP